MKRTIKSITLLCLIAGSLVMFSCKNEENKDDAPQPMQNEMHQPETDKQAGVEAYEGEDLEAEFKDENTAEIYNLYVEVKDAFVNTDAKKASEKANELSEKAKDNEDVASIARSISKTEDVNKQREAFSKLTEAMEPILTNALASGEIYKQYCPMAFEGKGDYWYSSSKDIFNPYYGDKMLKCGRVEETVR